MAHTPGLVTVVVLNSRRHAALQSIGPMLVEIDVA